MNGRTLRLKDAACKKRMKAELAKPPVYPEYVPTWIPKAETVTVVPSELVETMDFDETEIITPSDPTPDYESMSYNEVVELAKSRGLTPGRSKKSVIIADLKKYDEER